MIWESIPLMTMLDLTFIMLAVVGLVLLGRARRQWPLDDKPLGPAFIALGLVILGLFYTADLFVMFVLPGIAGRAESMVVMEQLHLNYSWIAFVTSGISVVSGAALTSRTLGRTSAELEQSEQRLGATLSQREQTLLDLQASQQRYVDLVSTSIQANWWFELSDPMPTDLPVEEQIDWIRDEGVFTDCNDVLATDYGYSEAADLIGRGVKALWGGDRELSEGHLRRFIENGHAMQGEIEAQLPNGELRWFHNWSTGIVRDGHLLRVVGSHLDVTERKRAEDRLGESE